MARFVIPTDCSMANSFLRSCILVEMVLSTEVTEISIISVIKP